MLTRFGCSFRNVYRAVVPVFCGPITRKFGNLKINTLHPNSTKSDGKRKEKSPNNRERERYIRSKVKTINIERRKEIVTCYMTDYCS